MYDAIRAQDWLDVAEDSVPANSDAWHTSTDSPTQTAHNDVTECIFLLSVVWFCFMWGVVVWVVVWVDGLCELIYCVDVLVAVSPSVKRVV
ncbi:hypothetical protein MUBE_13730, partial [Mycobacterium uberis]